MGGVGEDGWNTVTQSRTSRYPVDASKLKFAKDEASVSLGALSMHSVWSKGAGSKSRESMKSMPTIAGAHYSTNMYAALDTSNEDSKRQITSHISRYVLVR